MASGSQIELDEVRESQSRKEKEVEQELIPIYLTHCVLIYAIII